MQAALQGVSPTEVFLPAVSPGQIWFNFPNDYYPTDEACIYAVADALKHEYRAIVEAGFLLQMDSPELAMAWNRAEFAEKTFADYRQFVAQHVAAINYALEGIPADRVRLHLCWGNGERPHVRDCPIDDETKGILQTPTVPRAGPGGLSLHQAVAGQIHPGAHQARRRWAAQIISSVG